MSFPIIDSFHLARQPAEVEGAPFLPQTAGLFRLSNEGGQAKARHDIAERAQTLPPEQGVGVVVGSGQLPSVVDVIPAQEVIMVDSNPRLLPFWSGVHSAAQHFDRVSDFESWISDGPIEKSLDIIGGLANIDQEFGEDSFLASQANYERFRYAMSEKDFLGILGDLRSRVTFDEIHRAVGDWRITYANFTNVVSPTFIWPTNRFTGFIEPSYGTFQEGIKELPWHTDAIVQFAAQSLITRVGNIFDYFSFVDGVAATADVERSLIPPLRTSQHTPVE